LVKLQSRQAYSLSLKKLFTCLPKLFKANLNKYTGNKCSNQKKIVIGVEKMAIVAPEMDIVASEMDIVASEMDIVASEMEIVTSEMEIVTSEMEIVAPEMDIVAPEMEIGKDKIAIVEWKVFIKKGKFLYRYWFLRHRYSQAAITVGNILLKRVITRRANQVMSYFKRHLLLENSFSTTNQ
jgi:hypothetical protein